MGHFIHFVAPLLFSLPLYLAVSETVLTSHLPGFSSSAPSYQNANTELTAASGYDFIFCHFIIIF